MTHTNPEEWLTPAEVGRLLRIPTEDVEAACRGGELVAVRVGPHWRIRQRHLSALLDGIPEVEDSRDAELASIEADIRASIAQQGEWRAKQLKLLGPMPLSPANNASRDERVKWFFEALWWHGEHSRITLTPRAQAEAAHHAGGPDVDEIEDYIRQDRGLPPLDRDTGLERWDLLERDAEEQSRLEWWALDRARSGFNGNPAGLTWDEYLRVWRRIAGLVPAPPTSSEQALDRVRARRGLPPEYGHTFTPDELETGAGRRCEGGDAGQP